MAKPKKKQDRVIRVNTLKKFSISTRRRGITIQADIQKVATNNPESIAQTNLDHFGLTGKLTINKRNPVFVALTTQQPNYTKDGYFSFINYTSAERTKVIAYLLKAGNTASRWIARTVNMGLSARQLGQIRRWNNEGWQNKRPTI